MFRKAALSSLLAATAASVIALSSAAQAAPVTIQPVHISLPHMPALHVTGPVRAVPQVHFGARPVTTVQNTGVIRTHGFNSPGIAVSNAGPWSSWMSATTESGTPPRSPR